MSPSLVAGINDLFAGRLAVPLPAFGRALCISAKYIYLERQRGRLTTIGTGRVLRITKDAAMAYLELLEREAKKASGQ